MNMGFNVVHADIGNGLEYLIDTGKIDREILRMLLVMTKKTKAKVDDLVGQLAAATDLIVQHGGLTFIRPDQPLDKNGAEQYTNDLNRFLSEPQLAPETLAPVTSNNTPRPSR